MIQTIGFIKEVKYYYEFKFKPLDHYTSYDICKTLQTVISHFLKYVGPKRRIQNIDSLCMAKHNRGVKFQFFIPCGSKKIHENFHPLT